MTTQNTPRDPYQDVLQNTQIQEGDNTETVYRKQLAQANLEIIRLMTENAALRQMIKDLKEKKYV